MQTNTRQFRSRAAATMADPRLKSALEGVYEGFNKGRIAAAADTDAWEAQRDRGRAIKEHTIANLDYYLEMLADNVEKNGGNVFFARDSAEANRYVLEIAAKGRADRHQVEVDGLRGDATQSRAGGRWSRGGRDGPGRVHHPACRGGPVPHHRSGNSQVEGRGVDAACGQVRRQDDWKTPPS